MKHLEEVYHMSISPMNKGLQKHLIGTLLEKRGIHAETVDLEFLLDSTCHFNENIENIENALKIELKDGCSVDDIGAMLEDYHRKRYEEDVINNHIVINPKVIKVLPDVGIGMILGDIRSGKSCLGYGILEHYHNEGRKVALLGFPKQKLQLLPEFLRDCVVNNMDGLEEGSVFLADEAYIQWYARESNSKTNKIFAKLTGLCGHNDLLGMLVTQQSTKLEVEGPRSSRFIFSKRPSLLQSEFERYGIKKITGRALKAYEGMSEEESKLHVYAISHIFSGFIHNSNTPPKWWSEDLSKAWKGVSFEEPHKKTGEYLTDKQLRRALRDRLRHKKVKRPSGVAIDT